MTNTDLLDEPDGIESIAGPEQPATPPLTGERVTLSAAGFTLELDLIELLRTMDPTARYLGYDPDTDEDVYGEPSSLESLIADRAAAAIAKGARKVLRERVDSLVADEVRATVQGIILEHLEAPVQQMSEWGTPTGTAKPLRELIGAQVEDALRKPETRDGYGGGRETMVQRVIAAEVGKALKTELTKAVGEAREQALAAVKASAAEVIAETIDRARRGSL